MIIEISDRVLDNLLAGRPKLCELYEVSYEAI
jgi:hypothetical protein